MNSALLAKIYGLDKAASADPAPQEPDLDNMTARELLALLEAEAAAAEAQPEKTAGEELDLSQLTAAELLQLVDEANEVEKTASADDVSFYEEAGRAMARAFHDELEKQASPDELEIDLNEISGEDLVSLIEAGYEFADDVEPETEKVAGVMSELKGAFSGKQLRQGLKQLGESRAAKRIGSKAAMTAKLTGKDTMNTQLRAMDMAKARGKRGLSNVLKGGAKSTAAYGGAAAAAGGAAAGAAAGVKKMRKKKD